LWIWFCQHSLGLAITGMAPAAVTWEGVTSWAALMRIDLEPWEAMTIVRLGTIRASIQSQEMAKAK
jgi:hypothetical protein